MTLNAVLPAYRQKSAFGRVAAKTREMQKHLAAWYVHSGTCLRACVPACLRACVPACLRACSS
jgi:hypothetical protein